MGLMCLALSGILGLIVESLYIWDMERAVMVNVLRSKFVWVCLSGYFSGQCPT